MFFLCIYYFDSLCVTLCVPSLLHCLVKTHVLFSFTHVPAHCVNNNKMNWIGLKYIFLKATIGWSLSDVRKSWRRLFHLRCLRQFTMSPQNLLTGNLTTWYRSKDLQRVVRSTESITGDALPYLQDFYIKPCRTKGRIITEDSSHPDNSFFSLLRSRSIH